VKSLLRLFLWGENHLIRVVNPSLPLLEQLVRQFLEMLTKMSISGRLWVVEIGRIRVHQAPEDEGPNLLNF
jgi:hypothetical protein